MSKDRKHPSWSSSYSWLGATVAAAALAVYSWKYSQTVSKVKVHVASGQFKKVLGSVEALTMHYWPAPLAASAHMQTIVTVMRQATLFGSYNRQIVGLQDGGCVALDWWKGSNSHLQHPSASTPIVLILHGLTGGSQEGYIKWMARAVAASGWRAVVMNYRGCAGLPLTSPKCYDAVSTGDIRAAIVHIRRSYPTAPLYAVGYSLGAILLTKYTADADSHRFAPLSSHLPTATSLPPLPVSPHMQLPPLSPAPCASVASCATPATPVSKQSLPDNGSAEGVHTPRVIGSHSSSVPKWWHAASGSHGSNNSCNSPSQGWDWKSCSASWPAQGCWRAGSTGKMLQLAHSIDMYTSHATAHRSASTTGDCNRVGTWERQADQGGMGGHASSAGRAAGLGSGLAAAVAISNPFELVSASARLHVPWTMPWLYNLILTWRLKSYVRTHSRKISTLAPNVELSQIYASTTLREFDFAGTCKFLGFNTAHDYYVHGSSENYIPSIRTPFLFVSSEDDPFLGDLQTSTEQVLANPSTALALTRAGGHCAHLMGIMPLAHSWTDGLTMDVFRAVNAHVPDQVPCAQSPGSQHRQLWSC